MEPISPKTGMTHAEARAFIRNHFEEFVNKKNVQIGNVNFAADFVDHGTDVPPGTPPGPAGAIQYVAGALRRFPDLHVQIEDMDCDGFTKCKEARVSRDRDLANRQPKNRGALGLPRSPARGLIDATKLVTNSRRSVLRVTHPESAV